MQKRHRVLLIAEAANPEWVSVPLVGWSHYRALAEVADVHLVTQVRNRASLCRAGLVEGRDFTAIDSEAVARLGWRLSNLLRGGQGKGWTTVTAVEALVYYHFEYLVWKRFKAAIRGGDYDVVHRLTPLTPTAASLMASATEQAGVPFVVGPLNGGVPWPRQFQSARRREREWLSYVRGLYRLLPGYRSMRRKARAIIVGSRDTRGQMPDWALERCVYIPENAVDPARFGRAKPETVSSPLRVAFVGRLVPYKGADMLIEAAAELVRQDRLRLDIYGDGPQRPKLEALVGRLKLGAGVKLHGHIPHEQLQDQLRQADLMGFPSIREFGGGVVLEAMAVGVVPMVVNYGGLADLVTPRAGYLIELASRPELIRRFRQTLEQVVEEPGILIGKARVARERVLTYFTWQAKAAQTLKVYDWVLSPGSPKPDFGMPFPDLNVPENTTGRLAP